MGMESNATQNDQESNKVDIELFKQIKAQAESAQTLEELVRGMENSGMQMIYWEGGFAKKPETFEEKVKAVEDFARIGAEGIDEKAYALSYAQQAILDALERLNK